MDVDDLIGQVESEMNYRITRRDVLRLLLRKTVRAFARLEMARAHLLNGKIQFSFRGDKEGGVHIQPEISIPGD